MHEGFTGSAVRLNRQAGFDERFAVDRDIDGVARVFDAHSAGLGVLPGLHLRVSETGASTNGPRLTLGLGRVWGGQVTLTSHQNSISV